MKIPLDFVRNQYYVLTNFIARGYHSRPGRIDFAVDTGSDRSMIGYGDALVLRIPFSVLNFKKEDSIAGFNFNLYEIENVRFSFYSSPKALFRLNFKSFLVAESCERSPEKRQEAAEHIPSLLGIDFLVQNKMALYCNPYKKEGYLEVED